MNRKNLLGNEVNKALVDRLTNEYSCRGMEAFFFSWEGGRTPDTVTSPEGIEKKVGYMRDGLIFFKDGTQAVYDRIADDYPKQPQSIIVAYSSK
jgi:hypothetical protein